MTAVFPLKDNIPTDRFPVVTVALIVVNVLVYFFLQDGGWQLTSDATGDWPVRDYALVPCDVSGECEAGGSHVGDVASIFTSMFMHGGILHLVGNMVFLWIFGNNVEDSMGRLVFLAFYLAGGVAADALQVVVDPDASVPTLGASGAVSAVLGGYILLYPQARILTLIFIFLIELPAAVVLGLWFVEQIVFSAQEYGSASQGGDGVAYFAHIGGFIFGLATIRLLARRVKDVPVARKRRTSALFR